MRKNILWVSITFEILSVISLITMITLDCLGIFTTDAGKYLMSVLLMIVVWLPLVFELIFKIKLNLALVIALEIFMLLTIVIGSAWGVYIILPLLDKIVHFASGILFGLLFYDVYSKLGKTQLSPFWICLFVFSFSMMIGGVWEVIEFIFDGVIPGQNAQRWQGLVGREALFDTMYDLICDFVGSLIAAVVAFVHRKNTIKSNQEITK